MFKILILQRIYNLSDDQTEFQINDREKSKIRVRIEHIFGYMTMRLHGMTVRSIERTRAKFNAGLTNLV